MTRIRFLGVAAYELTTRAGKVVLVDPFLDENPGSPVKAAQLDRVDLVLVSHAAPDHLGDTEAIARRTGAPVICGGEVKAYLMARGIPADQIRTTTWGIAVEVAGIRVQPVECHHWSQIRMPDGSFASGVPMAFVVYTDPGVRFYHYGDTALFSDMKLQAELYRPTLGCIGIANPVEILHRYPMPGRMVTAEMSPREGALAAQWALRAVGTPEAPPVRGRGPRCGPTGVSAGVSPSRPCLSLDRRPQPWSMRHASRPR